MAVVHIARATRARRWTTRRSRRSAFSHVRGFHRAIEAPEHNQPMRTRASQLHFSRFLFLLLAVGASACSKAKPPRNPSTPVTVTQVKRATIPYVVTTNGTVEPMQTVAVEAQVGGILRTVAFSEGQEVHVGQVLFQID